jgi:hypothetical protein
LCPTLIGKNEYKLFFYHLLVEEKKSKYEHMIFRKEASGQETQYIFSQLPICYTRVGSKYALVWSLNFQGRTTFNFFISLRKKFRHERAGAESITSASKHNFLKILNILTSKSIARPLPQHTRSDVTQEWVAVS